MRAVCVFVLKYRLIILSAYNSCSLRSNNQRCSIKEGVLKNFEKFTGKHLCQSLFFNKIEGKPATLLKQRL